MKGYVHRWLSSATQVAPFLAEKILPVLQTSAEAAAKQCEEIDEEYSDGTIKQRCGFYWRNETFVDPMMDTSPTTGVGEGLSVFAAVTSLLFADAAAPATAAASGGAGNSSGSDSPSGTSDGSSPSGTAASDSGAGRFRVEITVSLLVGVTAIFAWIV